MGSTDKWDVPQGQQQQNSVGGGGDGLDEALAEREESRMTSRYLLLFW